MLGPQTGTTSTHILEHVVRDLHSTGCLACSRASGENRRRPGGAILCRNGCEIYRPWRFLANSPPGFPTSLALLGVEQTFVLRLRANICLCEVHDMEIIFATPEETQRSARKVEAAAYFSHLVLPASFPRADRTTFPVYASRFRRSLSLENR